MSKRGASHERSDVESQDSAGVRTSNLAETVIDAQLASRTIGVLTAEAIALAVADGHGSPASFRSAQGAVFAVQAGLDLALPMLEPGLAARMSGAHQSSGDRHRLAEIRKELIDSGGKTVVRQWTHLVSTALEQDGFRDDEFDRLVARSGPAARARVEDNPLLAYGSTSLGAVATADFIALWQLGDGDIVVVDTGGRVSRPIPPDPALLANETTSLCLPGAWQKFRFAVLEPSETSLVMLSTDGLANSYADDEAFLQFGRDVAARVLAEGLAAVRERLAGWLAEISTSGSGDDITVGVLSALPEPGPPPAAPLIEQAAR